MAKFNMVGLKELEREIAKRASLLPDAAPEMLNAGTDILVEYQRGTVIEKGLIETGDMFDSIKAGPVKEGKDGWYQEVWPQGRDRKGTKNAVKGFILEYGTSKSKRIEATHWMSDANDAAKEEIVEAMRKVWLDYTGAPAEP